MLKHIVQVEEVVPSHPNLKSTRRLSTVKLQSWYADYQIVQFERRLSCRESELALAHVRASAVLARVHGTLRKISALIHRDDGVGVIAQRIIGSDSKVLETVNWILSAMWMDSESGRAPSFSQAIEVFGWDIVREVAIVAMLHLVHVELAPRAQMSPIEMDRNVLAVLTGAIEFGSSTYAAALANVGVAGLAGLGGERYAQIRATPYLRPEDMLEAERMAFGFDHGVLGAFMLYESDFPESVCNEVFDHSMVGNPIWLAEQLAIELGLDGGLRVQNTDQAHMILTDKGLSKGRVQRILRSMESAAELPLIAFGSSNLSAA